MTLGTFPSLELKTYDNFGKCGIAMKYSVVPWWPQLIGQNANSLLDISRHATARRTDFHL
jgi:hypothetical protein